MRSAAWRITVFLLALAAQGAAGYTLYITERRTAEAADAARAFEEKARATIARVYEVRSAEQAYLAAGQGEAFWSGRAAALIDALQEDVGALERSAKAPEAARTVGGATDAVEGLRQLDASVRDRMRANAPTAAAAIVFKDAFEQARALVSQIESARTYEAEARTAEQRAAQQLELYALGGAALATLIALLLLLARRRMPVVEEPEADVALTRVQPGSNLQVGSAFSRMTPGRESSPAEAGVAPKTVGSRESRVGSAGSPGGAGVAPAITPDLPATAALCADFARVAESRELSRLLERASTLLDARGIVLWMADDGGAALRPAVSHGYSAQTLARMGTLDRQADNATAEAFRTGELRVVEGDAQADGAIVAPLPTPGGCVGVMSVEVRRGGESNRAVQAVAAILAAQIATLVPSKT